MDKPTFKLVGAPCGQHGQYTFYKALRVCGKMDRIIAIGDFFFVKLWQDSELVSVGELQLLWTDRVSDQTLVSLRLYFLPENTPDGRGQHGEDEVLAINEKVVVRADDLLTWVWSGAGWRWGRRAVWRGACAPPDNKQRSASLHQAALDFTDVDKEKNALDVDEESPGVVVFSYPQYCRYRAVLSRLEGIQSDWLRDSLVAALGGYAAPTKNTRILYCKDTFEYPELEGHQFVCNHLAPKLKGRPRGRRRRRARSRSHTPSSHSSDSDRNREAPPTPRRLTLRNGIEKRSEDELEDDKRTEDTPRKTEYGAKRTEDRMRRAADVARKSLNFEKKNVDVEKKTEYVAKRTDVAEKLKLDVKSAEDCVKKEDDTVKRTEENLNPIETSVKRTEQSEEDVAFVVKLERFYSDRGETVKIVTNLKDVSLRTLYMNVCARGGYEAVCARKQWRELHNRHPARARRHYERFLLAYETHECRNGTKVIPKLMNGKVEPDLKHVDTIDIPDSPMRGTEDKKPPSPIKEEEDKKEIVKDLKEELDITSKPAEELNREFLESLVKQKESGDEGDQKPLKITVKPVEKLIDPTKISAYLKNNAVKLFEDNKLLVAELGVKHNVQTNSVLAELSSTQLTQDASNFLTDLAQKLNLDKVDPTLVESKPPSPPAAPISALNNLSMLSDRYINGTATANDQKNSRPQGRSSLRSIRVKPTRAPSASLPAATPITTSPPVTVPVHPPVTNFGIHHPPPPALNSKNNSRNQSDDEIVEVPYKPKSPEIIDLDEYPESPQNSKKKKLDILKERGLEVTPIPSAINWPPVGPVLPQNPITPLINPSPIILNPTVQHQILTQAQLYQMYNIIPNYSNGIQPPRVIQSSSVFGTSGKEKTVYGNPKDPFMPAPHILQGTPVKTHRNIPNETTPTKDILDLTCRTPGATPTSEKPSVEIVRVPNVSSPSKSAQNLSGKNYTLIDGKAVVGSNLEITLVSPKVTPMKNSSKPPQKRSSNGKFVSTKTPTPPKEYPKSRTSPSPSGAQKKPSIVIPNYQIRDTVSPASSTGSSGSQNNVLHNVMKNHHNLAQMMELQKNSMAGVPSYMDPIWNIALYGGLDQRQLAIYRDVVNSQLRGYSGLLNLGAVANIPTTKNK